jgi:dTMP kinase
MKTGLMIVLEGSDGSGKATQLNLLAERLKAAGYEVAVFDFPRYNQGSAHFVKQYLAGKYGPASETSPYTASLFYALDRYEASVDIRKELDAGKIVLIDRFVGSNMAHQGSKFSDPVEQRGFFVWEDNLEFQLLKIPRPDINLFLRVPAETSVKLIDKRAGPDKSRDEHEADLEHLKKSVATYDLLCQLFPKDFTAIECTKDGNLLSIPAISNLIWEKLKPLLPAEKPHSGHNSIVTLSSAETQRPQRTNGDNEKLQQEFKNSSLYLKINVERHIKSVEPAGFSVWSDYGYKFYTPMGLPKNVEASYKASLAKIAELHQTMRQKLEQHYERTLLSGQGGIGSHDISRLLMPVTPLSALCSFNASLSQRAVQRLASSLLANDSQELQWSAKQLYVAAKNQWPEEFKKPLESATNPEPINNIIAKLAEDKLSLNSSDKRDVRLLEALPRQEFDLLAESIYPYSSLSLEEISEEVSGWSYQQKYESFKEAAGDQSILEKIIYKFDLITDQILMNEIVGTAFVNSVQSQIASPRFGYEVPGEVEEAGIDDLYLECFDESLKLFSLLQQADRDDLTVYATLLGHKLRWQFSTDAKNLKLIFEHKYGTSGSGIIDYLKESVAEAHPLTWEVLSGAGTMPAALRQPRKNRVKSSRRRSKSNSKKPNDK